MAKPTACWFKSRFRFFLCVLDSSERIDEAVFYRLILFCMLFVNHQSLPPHPLVHYTLTKNN